MPKYVCGLDLGQKKDYTAFVVAQVVSDKMNVPPVTKSLGRDNWLGSEHVVRHGGYTIEDIKFLDIVTAERFPLGTAYTQIIDMVLSAMSQLKFSVDEEPVLLIDATNNMALVDHIKQEHTNRNLSFYIHPVTITAGGSVTREAMSFKVPKNQLIQKTQLAMEQNIVRFAQTLDNLDYLIKELETYEVEITDSGSDVYNARSGQHDDLVLALSMAVWFSLKDGTHKQGHPGMISYYKGLGR